MRARSPTFRLISKGKSMFWRRLRQGSRFASWKIIADLVRVEGR